MKYYLMEPDKKSVETPQIYNWNTQITSRLLASFEYHELPQRTLLTATFAPNTTFKEIILMPFLLLPQEAAEVLRWFEPYLEYKDMPVMDVKRKKMHPYVFPLLKSYDCLSEESEYNRDKSVIIKAVMRKNYQPDCALFVPNGVNSRYIIAREDFCEALYKRYIFGFTLKEIEIER